MIDEKLTSILNTKIALNLVMRIDKLEDHPNQGMVEVFVVMGHSGSEASFEAYEAKGSFRISHEALENTTPMALKEIMQDTLARDVLYACSTLDKPPIGPLPEK